MSQNAVDRNNLYKSRANKHLNDQSNVRLEEERLPETESRKFYASRATGRKSDGTSVIGECFSIHRVSQMSLKVNLKSTLMSVIMFESILHQRLDVLTQMCRHTLYVKLWILMRFLTIG